MEGLIVLVTFTLAFVGIAVWVYLPRNKTRLRNYAAIPFQEETHDR